MGREDTARGRGHRGGRLSITVTAALMFPLPVPAATVVDNGSLTLSLNGWTRAGYRIQSQPGKAIHHGAYLGLATLMSTVEHRDLGKAVVQFEGASGSLHILDVRADAHLLPGLTLRIGHYRIPTSREYQLGAPFIPLATRSHAIGLGIAPRRHLGTEILGNLSRDSLSITAQLGVFNPRRGIHTPDPAALVSARMVVHILEVFELHAAYLHRVGPTPDAVASNPASPESLHPHPQLLDLAVSLQSLGFTARLEGIVSLDAPLDTPDFAAHLLIVYAITLGDSDHVLEPGIRGEVVRWPTGEQFRLTTGVSYAVLGHRLKGLVNYALSVDAPPEEQKITHEVLVQLQLGF